MSESIYERPLTIDEIKKVGAFYIEARSEGLRTYFTSNIKIVRYIDNDAVHLICNAKPHFVIAEFDNYNIGWRAWISYVSDEIRRKHEWGEVKKCKGVGYNWEYDIDKLIHERCEDINNPKVSEIWY